MTEAEVAAADVVREHGGYMASYVRRALARAPGIVELMLARNARIFVVETFHEDTVMIDDAVTAAIRAIDVEDTTLPFFVARIALYQMRFRPGGMRRPWTAFAVTPPRGVFLGAIGVGEGGAVFLGPDGELVHEAEAVRQLRDLLG